jgi:hypothetical protein
MAIGADRIYSALIKRNPEAEQQLPAKARRNIASNGLRQVGASTLQSSGDHTVNASTVLPWLLAALGAPVVFSGLLVPIRESGSMLPQAALTPWILRVRYRKRVHVAGSLIQSAAVATMAATAALATGLTAGLLIVGALMVFAFGRCLTSIASKDVQGRTISKGVRGQINGLATTTAGVAAITLGVAIRSRGGEDLEADQLALLLAAGAVLWAGAAWIYAGIREPDDPTTEPSSSAGTNEGTWFTQSVALLREDKPFRQFVMVRSLLLVSALSPPLVVTLSIQRGADSLAGLAGYIIASGVAALIGGRLFGRLADRSSTRLMSTGAGVASMILIMTVIVVALPGFSADSTVGNLLFIGVYLALTLTHTGVRIGRKTYVVDMAEGDQRTRYVAVSNSAMGVILLIVGVISSALATVAISLALLFLAAMGFIGVFAGARLRDVSIH